MNLALAEMYVQGVSTRKVIEVLQKLVGPEVSISSTQISRCAQKLDESLDAWRNRPLEETPYLLLDARYERVREAGQVVDCAVLVAVGVTASGHRRVLGVSVALSEAEVHWRAFLDSLMKRGLRGVKCIASDDHAGLKAARKAMFARVPWQRCQFHLQHNAQGHVSKLDQRVPVARTIRSIFNAPDAASPRTRALRRLRLSRLNGSSSLALGEQYAKALCLHVCAVDIDDGKLKPAKRLGADVVNARQGDRIAAVVKAAGGGAHHRAGFAGVQRERGHDAQVGHLRAGGPSARRVSDTAV